MNVALSPYHLTSHEPAALAALLLCNRAATFLPTPAAGVSRENVQLALRRSPRYERLLESWRWSVPLWRAGVLASLENGDDPAADVRAAAQRAQKDSACAGVQPFLHERLFDSPAPGRGGAPDDGLPHRSLDLLSADILKGGPDPGISIPVAAGLDRFAARHHFVAVRSGGQSVRTAGGSSGHTRSIARTVVQRAERMLSPALATIAVPVFVQASALTLLACRHAAQPQRTLLAAALNETGQQHPTGAANGHDAAQRVRKAAAAFGLAFDTFAADLRGKDDDSGRQVLTGFVRLSVTRLPLDAALSAACVAARTLRGGARPRPATHAPEGCFVALTVEPMALEPAL